MLVVTVEIWPGGDHGRARVLERGVIANVGGDGVWDLLRGWLDAALGRRPWP